MKDMMSSGLVKVAQTAKQSFAQVQQQVDHVQNSLGRMRDRIRDVDSSARSSSFFNGSLFRNLAGVIGTVSLMAFAKDSVAKAMNFGATKMAFQVMAGDPNKGTLLADRLNKLQQDTILGPEVFQNAQTMMGFGVGRKDGKTDISVIEKDMKMLGDVSMGNKEKFQALTLAFSQTQSAGKLMGQDLLQYINAGFNPLQTMSEHWKEFGLKAKTSVGQLREMMSKGQISAQMVAKAFEVATGKGGLFENMMDKIGKTSYGRLKILEGAFENLKIKTGETFMPIAEGLMKVGNYLIDHIEIVGSAVAAWGAYKAAVVVASTWQAILNGEMLMNPIGLVIAAIAALVVWITVLSKKYQGWSDALKGLEFMSEAFLISQKAIWSDVYEGIAHYLRLAGMRMDEFCEKIKAGALSIKEILVDLAHGNFSKAWNTKYYSGDVEATKRIAAENAKWATEHGQRLAAIQYANHLNDHGSKKMEEAWKNGLFTPKKDGVSPSGIPGLTGASGTQSGSLNGKDVASKIASGGPRVININGVKFMDKLELHTATFKEGKEQIQATLEEMFLRILNSGASVQ
jgi:tape measure domain-containing protein